MKRFLTALALTTMATGAWAADPVEGVWQSPTNDEGQSIQVTMAACGAAYCGTITQGSDAVRGERMVWDMTPEGGGVYSGGKIWAPDNDKTYKGKLELSGNSLKISGCVLGGAVCRGETFARLK